MKISAGEARGRKLTVPRGGQIRITSDRVKEALFNILGSVEGVRFLDMFAGTGNVGIEALSRGAAAAMFIEIRFSHAAVIRTNIERCGFGDRFEIIKASFDRGTALLRERGERFDVIFADPPYERGLAERAADVLYESSLLAPGGIIVVEHSAREQCDGRGGLILKDRRGYGDTVLSFFAGIDQGDKDG
ncbi:MAG TPA: 16S rRNA (guanine(966)-N(2))-methyltransferase RsmD [Deltaproteobacteria bacterium]|nr:16S rRNA (guanine(966)-N(2))-methyltransferase RsmD [Deltaproteobacteria bacterium]